jgi:hypothetical protein
MSLMTARDFWNTYQSAGGRAVLKGTRAAPERWLINVRAAAPGQGGTLYLCHESQRVPMRIADRSIVLPSRPPRQPQRKRKRGRKHA